MSGSGSERLLEIIGKSMEQYLDHDCLTGVALSNEQPEHDARRSRCLDPAMTLTEEPCSGRSRPVLSAW
jgi:hypothetical protein